MKTFLKFVEIQEPLPLSPVQYLY